MASRGSDEFHQGSQTPACLRGGHVECPHGFGSVAGFYRTALTFGDEVVLCTCECHVPCPVSGKRRLLSGLVTVSARTWRDSCTCPGSEAVRAQWERLGYSPLDRGELFTEARRRQQAQREAFDAAKAHSAGKSREEVRELYVAELRARGEEPPDSEALDAAVAAITGNLLPTVRLIGRYYVEAVRHFRRT